MNISLFFSPEYFLSFLMYCLLAIVCSGLILFSRKLKTKKIFYLISFSLGVLFFVYVGQGVDRENYIRNFLDITFDQIFFSESEMGFMLMNYVLHIFGSNENIVFFGFSIFMLSCVYYSMYKINNHKIASLGILIFYLLFFIQSCNLMRIYLAGAILLLSTICLLKLKYLKSLLLILLAFSFHFSALAYLLVYITFIIYKKIKIKDNVFHLLAIFLPFIGYLAIYFLQDIIIYLPIFERYLEYFENFEIKEFGLLYIAYYFPILLLLIYYKKRMFRQNLCYYDSNVKNFYAISIITSSVALFFGFLSYGNPMIARMSILFYFPLIVTLPVIFINTKSIFIKVYIIGYFLMRIYFYIEQYIIEDGVIPLGFLGGIL